MTARSKRTGVMDVAEETTIVDRLRETALTQYDKASHDEIADAADLISTLVDALRPFADVFGEDDEDFPDDTKVVVKFGRTTHYALTLGDFRKALAALEKAEGK